MILTRTITFSLLFFLYGCNSHDHIPAFIKMPPEQNIEYQQVKENTKDYQEEYVRWGGKIVSVENKEDSTWIEILANPLTKFGRPLVKDDYPGRFIARIDAFPELEQYKDGLPNPEYYIKDRYLTIYGPIETDIVRRIDEHPYNYPLVYAQEYYLWNKYQVLHRQHPSYFDPNPRHPYSRPGLRDYVYQ